MKMRLVVMDENGNKTEIPSKTADGRKFTKAVKATSGSFYNMVALYKDDQCALLRTDGTYFWREQNTTIMQKV